MPAPERLRALPPPAPRSLADRAIDDVHFIRGTMERAVSFTAVPGWGGVLMGAVALFAAPLASRAETTRGWLFVWIGSACLAVLIGASNLAQKARANRESLLRGPGWRFAMSLAPAFFAGACLTWVLYAAGHASALPGMWLLLYGVGVTAAGTFSIKPVSLMGVSFMALGVLAFVLSPTFGNTLMALGFGGLHVLFGLWIARHPHD
jgi:hypothetical protein